MSEHLPPPLVPAEVDLRSFEYMPLKIVQLFGSEFHARSSDGEWRAGVTLWLKSWHQVPAGSLPDDDTALCRLAELGRDLKTWRKVKAGALRGWLLCSDGRLYHRVVADNVLTAWERRQQERWRKECDRLRKDNRRRAENGLPLLPIPTFDQWKAGGFPPETDGTSDGIPPENSLKGREGKGRESKKKKDPEGGIDPDTRARETEPPAPVTMPDPPQGLDRRKAKPAHGIGWPVPDTPPPWAAYEAETHRLPAERLAEVYAAWVNDRLAKGLTPFDPVADWRAWLIREERFERDREAKRQASEPKAGESRWAI